MWGPGLGRARPELGRARPGLAVDGQDLAAASPNKALVVCFIMVLAVFSGGMGNQGSQAQHGRFFKPFPVDLRASDQTRAIDACSHYSGMGSRCPTRGHLI